MSMDLKEIENLIKEAMPDATIDIQDLVMETIIQQRLLPHNFRVKLKLNNIKWFIIH